MEYRKCVKIRVGVGKKAIFESCWLWRWHSEEKGMCGICLVPHRSDVVEGQQLAHTGHRDIPHHRASFPGHKVGEVVEGADHPSGRAGHQSGGAEQISGFSWGFPPSLSLSFPFQFPFCEGCLLSCRRTISGSISGSASSYSGSSSRSRSLSRSLSRSHSRSSSASVSHSPSGSRKSRYSPDPS